MKHRLIFLMVFCVALPCNAAPKKRKNASTIRDPFSCSHTHGNGTLTAQTNKSAYNKEADQYAPIASATDDVSSEWRVIAEKGNSVIMQHRDGNIREIMLSKN